MGCCLIGLTSFSADTPAEFVYAARPDGASIVPRYRPVEAGLPGGIDKQELLVHLDPELKSEWKLSWFVYGQPNSRSVVVAIRVDTPSDLFVDVNRDKRLVPEERIECDSANPRRWRITLDAEFLRAEGGYDHPARSVLIRQSVQGGLEIATEGVMRGEVRVAGRLVPAVRVDADANGCWCDARDRVMLDLDGNGAIDPIAERFTCDSVCRVDGQPYVLQSDLQGRQFEFVELSGVGSVAPQLKLRSQSARVRNVAGNIVSRSGGRVAISSLDQPVACPVGEYRIESLTLDLIDGEAGYWFQFAGRPIAEHGIIVQAGQSVDVNLLSDLKLAWACSTVPAKSGLLLDIIPSLETSTGLYLTGCKVGRDVPSIENPLVVRCMVDTRILSVASSGFS
jgi:hypothetical protein